MKTYLIIASNGYWGKADSLTEACKNANIAGTQIKCRVFVTNTICDDIYCQDFGSGAWTYTDKLGDWYKQDNLRLMVNSLIEWGEFYIKISKGKAQLTVAE